MLRVGLSGGIGSGKSTVSRRLVERGAELIDSDVLAREVVAPGTEGLHLVRDRFGDTVIQADGSLDRPALGRVVFGDAEARDDLNAIVHPRVLEATRARMESASPDAVVVHDIPLLVELDRAADYHLTVIVAAHEEHRLRRLVDDRGMSESDARARIAAQATDEQRRAAADVWLPNEATVGALHESVDALWEQRLVPFERNLRTATPPDRPAPEPDDATVRRLVARVDRHLDVAGLTGRARARSARQERAGTVLTVEIADGRAEPLPPVGDALRSAGFVPAGPVPGGVLERYRSADPFCPVPLVVTRTA